MNGARIPQIAALTVENAQIHVGDFSEIDSNLTFNEEHTGGGTHKGQVMSLVATGILDAIPVSRDRTPMVFRGRRVVMLLFAIVLMNAFDLTFTLEAHRQGVLVESNPLANYLLGCGVSFVTLYKISLVACGSLILLLCRRNRFAEGMVWAIALIYVGVSLQWMYCYDHYEVLIAARTAPLCDASFVDFFIPVSG